MRAIINLAALSIRLALQDTGTWFLSFAMPILMMVVLASAINSMADNLLRLDVVNLDVGEDGSPTAMSQEFIQQLLDVSSETGTVLVCVYGADDNPENCEMESGATFEDDGQERLEDEVAAAIIIPQGFHDAAQSGLPVNLIYQSKPDLNSATVTRNVADIAAGRLSGSIAISNAATNAAVEVFAAYDNGADSEAKQAAFDMLLAESQSGLADPPALVMARRSDGVQFQGANQSVPGIASMFVFITLLSAASLLVLEREQGTLQRLYILPTQKFNIIMGKLMGGYVFGVIQFIIFIVVGVMLEVNWGTNYPAIALVVLSFCFVGAALGFLLSTMVRTSDQAGGIALIMSLTLAPLGGAWWPLEIVPDTMRTIGHISPIAWAMDGFTEIIYHEGGVVDVLPMVGVMIGMATICIALAIWRFKYE